MPNSEKFYITTTLPYVNAPPHLGFALELVEADAIARYQKSLGKEVAFNTGTDEHGIKIYRKALDEDKDPQVYVNEYAPKFKELLEGLNIEYTHFTRTTDSHHKEAAKAFWLRCEKNGDIEKKLYKIKYCVGCELEKTDSELVDGHCILHPNLKVEISEEENYFFKFSRYRDKLLAFYDAHPHFVVPESRYHEMKEFVKRGLQDFSISRLKSKMPWGVPVPGDEEHVMYVWFDALVNYIGALNWPEDEARFGEFWGTEERPNAVQIAGKDNLRQQAAMWQAMLMSAGLPPSKQILIHGFITSGGQKMSKSLGNVVNPLEIIEVYGADALRYWLLREANMFEDSDFTPEKFKESYNANLANGLGNLVSRLIKLAEIAQLTFPFDAKQHDNVLLMENYELKDEMNFVWNRIAEIDSDIQLKEPFNVIKKDPMRAKEDIKNFLVDLSGIAYLLQPFLPETSNNIYKALETGRLEKPLFPRVQ